MTLQQINAASCAIPVTLSLWTWTRLKIPSGSHSQESVSFRKQSLAANWMFFVLVGLECLAISSDLSWIRWFLSAASGAAFVGFSILSVQNETSFWSKGRNRVIGIVLTFTATTFLALLLAEVSFIPLFAAIAISTLCHKRFEQEISGQIRDIETLHAKLLKQEAQHANNRHFKRAN